MRHLVPILSSAYWTTAAESQSAANGFTLTGGTFSQSMQVEFATGNRNFTHLFRFL